MFCSRHKVFGAESLRFCAGFLTRLASSIETTRSAV